MRNRQLTFYEYANMTDNYYSGAVSDKEQTTFEKIVEIYKEALKAKNLERTLNYGSGTDMTCEEFLAILEEKLK